MVFPLFNNYKTYRLTIYIEFCALRYRASHPTGPTGPTLSSFQEGVPPIINMAIALN
ncbi:MAG: hypothetical protein F6K39_10075 [Okeania sp. SIO3B3]|nr:hypothetical protein [Okeania sp. SIO3B3]